MCDHGDKTKNCDLTQNVIDRLCKFRHGSKLRIAILNILVKTIDAKNYEDLKCQFNLIDSDNTGLITIDELKGVINKKEGMNIPEADMAEAKRTVRQSIFILVKAWCFIRTGCFIIMRSLEIL